MPDPTITVHQVNLSPAAYSLLRHILGMWQGASLSGSIFNSISREEGFSLYTIHMDAICSEFGIGMTPEFVAALNEIVGQLPPRES